MAGGAGAEATDCERPAPDYRRRIKRLLDDPSFAAAVAAQAIAARDAGDDPAARLAAIVDRVEAVISKRRSAARSAP